MKMTIQQDAIKPPPFQVISQVDYCVCGCNAMIPWGNNYVRGHQNRGRKVSKTNESTKCVDYNNPLKVLKCLLKGKLNLSC